MKRTLIPAAFLLTISVTGATAQTVNEAAHATLQALVGRDATGFITCGVRAIVMQKSGELVNVHDFSISIRRGTAAGLMKAGMRKASLKKFSVDKILPDAVTPAPKGFWISASTEGRPLASDQVIPAEDKGFILATGDIGLAIPVITAIAAGNEMQFSTQFLSDRLDDVVAFSATLKDQEKRSLVACMKSVTDQIKQGLEDELKRELENGFKSPQK